MAEGSEAFVEVLWAVMQAVLDVEQWWMCGISNKLSLDSHFLAK